MSFEANNIEHEREVETDNEEVISLLKAILVGIALISNTTPEELIDLSEDLKNGY